MNKESRLIKIWSGFFALCHHCLLDAAVLNVTNELHLSRMGETVELPWKELEARVPGISPSAISVVDEKNVELVSQVVVSASDPTVSDSLLFQANFAPGQARTFQVLAKSSGLETVSKVNAMFYPARADDFSWENDRLAFRMYGPALMKKSGPQSGVDVWGKHVSDLVAIGMYERERTKTLTYHRDDGRAVDGYNAGKTRGCGGSAAWSDGKLVASKNFISSRVLANGPIRASFELTFEPWLAGKVNVGEVKKISIDLGSQLNRFESRFDFNPAESLTIAAGVAIHEGGVTRLDQARGLVSVWEAADGADNGMLGLGIVAPKALKAEFREAAGHALVLAAASPGEPMVYYAGAGWSKRDFPDASIWQTYLSDFAGRLASPLKVEWGKQ